MSYYGSRERTREKSRSPRRSSKQRKRDRRRSSSSSPVHLKLTKDNTKIRHETQRKNRVRFQRDDYLLDIKFFKKSDEPSAKNLSDADLFEYKLQLERENYSNVMLDSEQIKHKESLMEGDAMKKAKQHEKSQNQKLLLCKQEISYYPPAFLKTATVDSGTNSVEKDVHDNRISSTLGCYYAKVSEIPEEPSMSGIINDIAPSVQPKVILFEGTNQKDHIEVSKFTSTIVQYLEPQVVKEVKAPKRSILKKSSEELKKLREQMELEHAKRSPNVDPKFMYVIRDVQLNREKYTPEQIELMFKPFKDNGTFEINIKKMKDMSQVAKSPPPQPQSQPTHFNPTPHTHNPQPPYYPQQYALNPSMYHPHNSQPPQSPSIMQMPPPHQMQPQNMMRNVRIQKYKTVPCKYFHSSQGCQKKTECTFIHDTAFAGRETPQMEMRYKAYGNSTGGYQPQSQYQYNAGQAQPRYYPQGQYPQHGGFNGSGNNYGIIHHQQPGGSPHQYHTPQQPQQPGLMSPPPQSYGHGQIQAPGGYGGMGYGVPPPPQV